MSQITKISLIKGRVFFLIRNGGKFYESNEKNCCSFCRSCYGGSHDTVTGNGRTRGGVKTIYVDQNAEGGASGTYKTIQEAVNNASAGDTIEIAEGKYDISNLGINVAVNLKGKGPDKTVLEGQIIYSVAGDSETSISVEDIKFKAETESQNLALCWRGNGDEKLSNYKLNF